MIKRLFDIAVSAVVLVLLSPVLVITALLVRAYLGAPVVFAQRRPGLHGQAFVLYKFRTMREARGEDGELLPDEQRLTQFGGFLRKSSLDELPTLFNVLKGDMSLVGPRPLLMEYLPLYSARHARRHEVRPGLTGWAQIHGRNETDWDERLNRDVWYVDHQSFLLDLRIIAKTLGKVLRGEGVSKSGHVTMPKFQGSHDENR